MKQIHPVSLAGIHGPIYNVLISKIKNFSNCENNASPLGWGISEGEIVQEIVKKLDLKKGKYRLIIDLKPNVANNLSLYFLKRIFGFSYSFAYTPIVLQLEPIFIDEFIETQEKLERMKKEFALPAHEPELVHEFLYLQGGRCEGSWIWGRVGMVNGTLLWPDAFDFLVGKVLPYLK